MIQMIKREYVLNKLFFLSVYLLFPFIYLVNISPIFMYFGIILGYIFNLFYYDHHNQLNHFIVSLPIKKSNIVLGRYASSFIFMTVSLLYLWLIDTLAHYAFSLIEFLPTIEYKPITASTIIGTFILITIAVTVSMPIYYFFQSALKSLFAQGAILIIGSVGIALLGKYILIFPKPLIDLIFNTIEFQPLIFFIAFSFICWYLSYRLSTAFFLRRDLV